MSMHCLAGDDEIRLGLREERGYLIVSIENMSPKDIRVSDLFTQNPADGLIELEVFSGGHQVGLVSPPNEPLPTSSNYLNLKPLSMFGRLLPIEEIRRWYGVKTECFSISVTYHDMFAKKFKAIPRISESNKIDICQ